MKKILILVLILALSLATVQAESCTTTEELLQERLDVKYDFAFYRIENHRIGMEGIIEYLEDEGESVSKLEEIKDEFVDKGNELKNVTDIDDFDDIVNELKGIVLKFKEAARDKVEDLEDARRIVELEHEIKEKYLKQLRNTAYDNEINHQQNRFDASVCMLQQRIDTFEKLGYDMSGAKLKLNKYEDYHSDIEKNIEDALEDCEDVPLFKCTEKDKKEYDELKEEIRLLFIETRTYIGIEIAEETHEKTQEYVEKLEELDIETEDFDDNLDRLKDKLDKASDYFSDEEYDSATDELVDFRDDTRDLREDMRKAWKKHRGDSE